MNDERPFMSPAFRIASMAILAAVTTVLTRVVQIPTPAPAGVHQPGGRRNRVHRNNPRPYLDACSPAGSGRRLPIF